MVVYYRLNSRIFEVILNEAKFDEGWDCGLF